MSQDEPRQPLCLLFVERDSRLGAAGLVPDAEAHVPLFLAPAEVARHAKCLAAVALELLVRMKELDELPPLRRRAPGAVVESRLNRAAALGAVAHLAPPLRRRLQRSGGVRKRRVQVPGTETGPLRA